jgi:hypothetical protein
VTHIPEAGTTEPSVRFFVRVAAEALILDKDICHSPFLRALKNYFSLYDYTDFKKMIPEISGLF